MIDTGNHTNYLVPMQGMQKISSLMYFRVDYTILPNNTK